MDEFREPSLVKRETIGLSGPRIGREAKPIEIGMDRVGKLLGRTRKIGIVQPEQEAPAMLARPQPIVERGADIADMEPTCGRRRETGDDGSHAAP